jgi:hypothetical protein
VGKGAAKGGRVARPSTRLCPPYGARRLIAAPDETHRQNSIVMVLFLYINGFFNHILNERNRSMKMRDIPTRAKAM